MDWVPGIFFIGIVCFLLSYLILKINDYGIRAIVSVLSPFIISYFLYWGPVWLKGVKDKSEYESWSWVFIFPWAIIGIFAMFIGLLLMPKKIIKNINKKG